MIEVDQTFLRKENGVKLVYYIYWTNWWLKFAYVSNFSVNLSTFEEQIKCFGKINSDSNSWKLTLNLLQINLNYKFYIS